MSSISYEIKGFGIQFNNQRGENTTVEKINSMLDKAPCLKNEIYEWIEDCGETENITVDIFSEFEQDYYCGIPSLIAKTINEVYGEDFVNYACDEDGYLYIYVAEQLPWEMSDFVKSLTKEKIKEIFLQYYKMLYDIETEITEVSIKMFG